MSKKTARHALSGWLRGCAGTGRADEGRRVAPRAGPGRNRPVQCAFLDLLALSLRSGAARPDRARSVKTATGMSRAFQVHWEILPEAQRRLWPELRPTVQLGLVLYGGTAIALRLGHRSHPWGGFLLFEAVQYPLDWYSRAVILIPYG